MSNQTMHLCPLLITLLLPFFLNASSSSAQSSNTNNPANTITRLSINCGSAATSAAFNGRQWIGDGDIRPEVSHLLQIKGSTVTRSSTSADQVPHNTARISPSQFSYAFRVTPGEKILRLHFNPASYEGFERFNDLFNVEAGAFNLLTNFSASLTAAALGANTFSKEFCISVQENQALSIVFSPVNSQLGDETYAFINGIEIIPVPLHLSYFRGGDPTAQVVGQRALVYIDNSTALELAHRVDMKRDSVSFSDEFDDMMGMRRENEINSVTWKTPVDVGFRYLVRIHSRLQFTENRGVSLIVLVNEVVVVDDNMDEYDDTLQYRDYVVAVKGRKQEGKRDLFISLQSYDELINGNQFIKGFEVFKLSNPDNSLASSNAFPTQTDSDSPSWTIHSLLLILYHRNETATLAIAILALVNIFVHTLREICEASITEENRPSARAERICRRFSLAEIQSATKNFSEGLLIGRGGFGKVYKGVIHSGGETVAIKRLKSSSRQGRHEFLTEIETLSELRHINLVSLIGYCSDYKEMILVYEYMPNGTLADHLYKYAKKGDDSCTLTWKQRLNICIGAGRGLDYLHTGHGIIHRDVKASNILLDDNFIAKVSDFGLAKPENRSKLQSHVSTKVKGTYGYLDPYYFSTRKLTRKSDTYAFGVVLLELLCERQAMDPSLGEDEYCLTRWARNKINEGEVNQIVASSLMEDILPDSLKVFVEVAYRCLHDEPKKRPTIAQVVLQLESALEMQENRKIAEPNHIAVVAKDVCPSNEYMMSSGNIEQSAEACTDEHADISPPTERTNSNYFTAVEKDGKKPKLYKPSRSLPWDASWNRLKPSKRKELSLISVICEANIRLPKVDFSKIAAATHQFSTSHKIGEGASATVYKAVLPTGRTIAVKDFSKSGQDVIYFFRNEIVSVSSLHHQNIIKLLGYCIHEQRGMLLYEFMENGSLDKFIFDEHLRHQLQWSVRFKVIIGIAKGLSYLHQESRPVTIHRDLNPSNILLDNEMNPKISGFDLARNIEDDQSELFTQIAGTFGYLSPESLTREGTSEKTDVYSFGVLVLEMLSGTRNTKGYSQELIPDAWKLWIEEGDVLDHVDESLAGEFSEEEALRCIQVGLLCTQDEPEKRPTMPCALEMLLGEESTLQHTRVDGASTTLKHSGT